MPKSVNKSTMEEYRGAYNPNDRAYWCKKCEGWGKVDSETCPICQGEGLIKLEELK